MTNFKLLMSTLDKYKERRMKLTSKHDEVNNETYYFADGVEIDPSEYIDIEDEEYLEVLE